MLSDLAYLSYPLPPDIQRLFEAGDFARMNRIIDARIAAPETPQCLKDRLRFQQAVAAEIPRAYPYTQAQLLAMLRRQVRDFSEDELEALRDDGTLDWRYVDGEVRFKDNCIDSMLKTRAAYAARALNPQVRAGAAQRSRALDAVIAGMKAKGCGRLRFTLREQITVSSPRLTPGETLRVHLPLPVVHAQVAGAQLLATSHAAAAVNAPDEPHRSVYFELPYEPGMTVWADIAYEINAPYVQPDPDKVVCDHPDFCLEEQPPHVVFTPYLRALAKEIVGGETNPLRKARLIYDFITTKAVYRYMPPYMTVANIPEYFLSGLRGDCGVQAITFITLCRLAGIPAVWQAGLYTTPDSTGNHDWARFYVAPYGWLYADCSFGGSAYRTGNADRWNFYFGNLEPWRLPLCSDFQQELNPPRRFLRRDPYDNQNGEIESLTRALSVDEYETASRILSCEELN
ncbi:MAG: transglutaminase domain-containing protein [Clostridia bacterium]|nr:transglutaminase domain-containing protein [Clostridia bacterium]